MKYCAQIARCLVVLLVGGCATYDPNRYYDPAATETFGKIVGKRVVATEVRPSAEHNSGGYIPIVIGGGLLLVPTNAFSSKASISIYEYSVETADRQSVAVLSEFFDYDVGNCVKVFLSDRASYPRIAPWSCDKK